MKHVKTKAIVLKRLNFGEADRIVTVLTNAQGLVSIIAKGSRKSTSKLAGAIELFSISDIVFIDGRGEIKTLISARLIEHFDKIVADLSRSMLAYEMLKLTEKFSAHTSGDQYFELCKYFLEDLNFGYEPTICELWLRNQLLSTHGRGINLLSDVSGNELKGNDFDFALESMTFAESKRGQFSQEHIKFLRLAQNNRTSQLSKVVDSAKLARELLLLFKQLNDMV